MRLSRRPASSDADDVTTDTTESSDAGRISLDKSDSIPTGSTGSKGRPTPKRRVAEGRRGPVTAPKTRKEAYARQKQLDRDARERRAVTGEAAPKSRSAAEQRAALKRGDPSALPKRDQGDTRRLARDYVDSHRMFSNYMLWLFVLFIVVSVVPGVRVVSPAILVIFLLMIGEWYWVGRKVRLLAIERFGSSRENPMSLGFYMGSRSYLPRKWRLPGPQAELGDEI